MVLDQHRTIAEVARELGINEQTLGNWVRQERIDRGEREGLTSAEREEMTRLRRQVKQLTMERDLAKRCLAFADPARATSDPLPLDRSPGGRGRPSSGAMPSSEGLSPGVLRLATLARARP
ncbi:transposase [Acidimicrobium ferrooxidans]|uniref:transposase n=1 Tax=Acidimicrobium ferrooxidans TaxID=53635 RepID=UPI0002F7F219|nr:transposase [Acidimicrobium ferrooxidans]